jgi:hypothetical protein
MLFTVRCGAGAVLQRHSLYKNDCIMLYDALSRCTAPHRSAPDLSIARRGEEGYAAASERRAPWLTALICRTARVATYSLKKLRCGSAPHRVISLYEIAGSILA